MIDYATAASGLADCFATTTGMRREPMNYQRFQFLDTTGRCASPAAWWIASLPPLPEWRGTIIYQRFQFADTTGELKKYLGSE
ncbi:MAG: hypothetical protein VCA73_10900 [Roseibacillus sp.]